MEKSGNSTSFKSIFNALVIPISLGIGIAIFLLIMGAPENFKNGNSAGEPLPGNYFGMIYKGGFVVPLLMTLLLIVLIFSVERFISITSASGKSSVVKFVRSIKSYLSKGQMQEAMNLCDKQKGSVANVIKSGLHKYQEMEADQALTKDQKILAIQKEIEEATALELPGLQQNLVVIATISTVATLMALLGTVLGMIRAFAAMANSGSPDSVALANGISEALINTALGIGTATLAVIMYNVFTTKIDKLTFSIDEAGFSIVQTYAANHK